MKTPEGAPAPLLPEFTDKPLPRPAVVSPSQVLLAIAQHEPLEATLRALPGMTKEQLQRLLRGAAISLARAVAPAESAGAQRPAQSGMQPQTPAAGVTDPASRPSSAEGPGPQAASRKPQADDAPTGSDLRRVSVFSDGAARGNPGPAGAGAVVLDGRGRVVARVGKFLGRQTNNVAEYQGVLIGLRRALQLGAREVDVRADSQLMIRQLDGSYKVKNAGLLPLFKEAKELLRKFDKVTLRHVPREDNGLADEMSNRAIDEELSE